MNNILIIEKGERIENVILKNTNSINTFDLFIIKFYYQLNKLIKNKFIHFGEFNINKKVTIIDFLDVITKPSNIFHKITIIEGWSQKDLDNELSKYFKEIYSIPYEDVLANTYFIKKNEKFDNFVKRLKKIKNQYLARYKKNKLNKQYNHNEIMIIGSLIEKEGLDISDKTKISSVIFNRLNQNMKLQIDATVLFAITNGQYNLNRKLLIKDLKYNHPYNTYIYNGLPPKPISYVGNKTIDLIFENNKTEFLFYFFNYSLNRHIFSKTYSDHKKKLYEYRSNQ